MRGTFASFFTLMAALSFARFSPITNRNIVIDVGGDNKLTANRTLKDAGIKDRL